MSKSFHMSISVRGLLKYKLGRKSLKGFFDNEQGQPCTHNEALDYLHDCLSKGWEVIPMGECNNFCYKEGCKGHESTPE